jgi:hypothetical protein
MGLCFGAICVSSCRLIRWDAAREKTRGRARAPSTPGRLGNNTMETIYGTGWLYGKWVFSQAMAKQQG